MLIHPIVMKMSISDLKKHLFSLISSLLSKKSITFAAAFKEKIP